MEYVSHLVITLIESGGLFAPILFICFHLLRPLFFLPVIFICIFGGMMFGPINGTLYSVIGITLSSIFFYGLIHFMPKTFHRLIYIKHKIIGKEKELNTFQIGLLRLIPFIHFHLLSLCLIEISSSFKDYLKSSFLTNLPLAFIYTFIGQTIAKLTPLYAVLLCVMIIPLVYITRRKEINIKWQVFFSHKYLTVDEAKKTA